MWGTAGFQLTKCHFCLQAALMLLFTWCSLLSVVETGMLVVTGRAKPWTFGSAHIVFISIFFIFSRQDLVFLSSLRIYITREGPELLILFALPSRFKSDPVTLLLEKGGGPCSACYLLLSFCIQEDSLTTSLCLSVTKAASLSYF